MEHRVLTVKNPKDSKELETMLNDGWQAIHALATKDFLLYIMQRSAEQKQAPRK